MLIPMLAHADRRAAIQSLLDEPANLLDITMLRLQDFIIWTEPNMALTYRMKSESEVRSININADYVVESGQIKVSVSVMDTQSTPAQMEAGCDSVLEAIHINLTKSLPGLFIHVDDSYPLELEEMNFNFAELIELSCYVHGTSSTEVRYRDKKPLALDNASE